MAESNTQYSIDTLLGIIAHSCLSLGVVTVALLQNVRVDLMAYLFGDLLALGFDDLYFIAIGVSIVLGILIFFGNLYYQLPSVLNLLKLKALISKECSFY